MAKALKKDAIQETDITEYLNTYSDFAFEIKVLKILSALSIKCSHSGTYTDPITGKSREYDIRGTYDKEYGIEEPVNANLKTDKFVVRQYFPVECKNLKTSFPLVIHCVEREQDEAFVECIASYIDPPAEKVKAISLRQTKSLNRYKINDPVGKSSDQVGRPLSNDKEIMTSDSDVYDKISQAVNSANDLIQLGGAAAKHSHPRYILSYVNPLLVVPDETLWTILYNEHGEVISGPEKAKSVAYYIGKEWEYNTFGRVHKYNLSHIDIVTFSELEKYINKIINIDKDIITRYFNTCTVHGQQLFTQVIEE